MSDVYKGTRASMRKTRDETNVSLQRGSRLAIGSPESASPRTGATTLHGITNTITRIKPANHYPHASSHIFIEI